MAQHLRFSNEWDDRFTMARGSARPLPVATEAQAMQIGRRAKRLVLRVGLLLTACALCGRVRAAPVAGNDPSTAERAADSPSSVAASYIPSDAVGFALLRDAGGQIERLHAAWDRFEITDSPAFERLSENPQFTQLQIGLGGIAAVARMDAWELFSVALGSEVGFAVVPSGGKGPGFVLVVIPKEKARFDVLLEKALRFAGVAARHEKDDTDAALPTTGEITPLGAGAIVRTDDALLISNQSGLLRRCLAVHQDGKERVVDANWWADAMRTAPADAALVARMDIATLRSLTGAGDRLPELLPNPLAGLLLGGAWHTLRNADAATLWVSGDRDTLRVTSRIASATAPPDSLRGFSGTSGAAAWRASWLPRYLGELRVNRRWDALFSDRESYMTIAAAEEFAKFSTTLTTLLGQLDVSNDLLPRINGPVRLIFARQEFPADRTPTPKLPAIALVVPLDVPEKSDLARRLLSGAQSALSLVNFQQAQNQQPTYVIDVDRYKDVKLVFAEYPPDADAGGMMSGEMQSPGHGTAAADGDPASDARSTSAPTDSAGRAKKPQPLNIRHNFAPAVAVVNNQLVIATTRKLLEDTIDATLTKADAGRRPAGIATDAANAEGGTDVWTVDLTELSRLLLDNRKELVMQRMLEQDLPRARATAEIDMLLDIAAFGRGAELSLKQADAGYELGLCVTLQKPPPDQRATHKSTSKPDNDKSPRKADR